MSEGLRHNPPPSLAMPDVGMPKMTGPSLATIIGWLPARMDMQQLVSGASMEWTGRVLPVNRAVHQWSVPVGYYLSTERCINGAVRNGGAVGRDRQRAKEVRGLRRTHTRSPAKTKYAGQAVLESGVGLAVWRVVSARGHCYLTGRGQVKVTAVCQLFIDSSQMMGGIHRWTSHSHIVIETYSRSWMKHLLNRLAMTCGPVGILPGDAAGRGVFSRIPRFPRPCILALLHTHFASRSLALKSSKLRAAQIIPLPPPPPRAKYYVKLRDLHTLGLDGSDCCDFQQQRLPGTRANVGCNATSASFPAVLTTLLGEWLRGLVRQYIRPGQWRFGAASCSSMLKALLFRRLTGGPPVPWSSGHRLHQPSSREPPRCRLSYPSAPPLTTEAENRCKKVGLPHADRQTP
ncbi:hypothetical protein PR048_026882 [Dryococelus australis]|uniref:Uncharacterized protein n=1 Tax=Dryococelus australis TaxID=614101 RepID=A0ABQ9GMK7_9NEOP|nr:hypothetical protein PR048_026882 [Dryococelus australis]